MIYAGVSSCFALRLDEGHVPTFWLLLPEALRVPDVYDAVQDEQVA